MKNNSFSLKSTADPFFFCRLHKISSKYWSRNRANTGEKHGFLVTLLKFSTICSRYKMFPPWHVKITPVCGIKLAGVFFNTFPWQSENFDRKDNKKNSKVIKLDNLWIKRDDGNVTTRKLAFQSSYILTSLYWPWYQCWNCVYLHYPLLYFTLPQTISWFWIWATLFSILILPGEITFLFARLSCVKVPLYLRHFSR